MPKFLNPITITTPGGSAPLIVNSSTLVTNLNADLLDGQHGSFYQNAGNLNAGTLQAARLPAFSGGDVTSTAGTVALTLANSGVTAGTYRSVTTDAKGRVTAGTNPTTLAGYGITDALPLTGGTLTGGLTGTTASFSGAVSAPQYAWASSKGYETSNSEYSGPRTLFELAYALAQAHGSNDSFRYKTVLNRQSWNGSAWITDNSTAWTNALTPDGGGTTVITQAEYAAGTTKKRFTIDVGGDWQRANLIFVQRGWNQSDWAFSLEVERSTDNVNWTSDGVQSVPNGPGLAYFSQADTGQTRWFRITVAATQVITAGGLTIIRVMALGPRYATVHPFTVDYSRNVSFAAGITLANPITSTVATGTAPFVVASTTQVNNLNAQLLGGQLSTYYAAASSLTNYLPLSGGAMTGALALHSTGTNGFYNGTGDAATYALYNFKLGGWNGMALENLAPGGTYPSQVVGVIDFRGGTIDMKGGFKVNGASVITENQSITISGDASGTGKTAINLTLASVGTAGTYRSVTTDAKGRVTAGTNPTTLAGYGITDALPLTGGTLTGTLSITNTGPIIILRDSDSAAGASQIGYISLQDSAGTERGWIGFGSTVNTDLTMYNGRGDVVLSSSTGVARVGSNAIIHAATTSAPNLSVGGSSARWANGRTISLTGDVSGTSAAFDGTAALSFATTLANSGVGAGTYRSVTVNAKGLVTAGTNPTTLSGYGITDAMYQVDPNGFTQGDIYGSGNMQRLWGTDSVQNLIAFRPPTTVEYTTDNVNWVATTISNDVFDGKVFGKWAGFNMNAGSNVGAWTKVRMTWVNFGYHFFSHFTLAHSTNGHSMNFVFYKSDLNGVFSSESYRVNGISSWPGYTFTSHVNVSGHWDTRDVRMVFELNGNNGPSGFPNNAINIGHIGIMGGYSSFNRVFDWDGNRNITLFGNLTLPGNVSATGTVSGSSFSGAGTNLTGTANSLNVGGYSARWATGRTIALTGDVTGTSGAFDGTAALSFGVTIANSAVTYAKIQNVAAASVLGNSSASVAQAPAALSMATLAGMLSNQTMNINGSSASCTGNAATATKSNSIAYPFLNTSLDLNTSGGSNELIAFNSYYPSGGAYNQPIAGAQHFRILQFGRYDSADSNFWRGQMAMSFYEDRMWFRRENALTWQSWREFIHSGNVGSYALPITGGTVTGNSGVLLASTNDARFNIQTGTAGAWLDIRSETLGYAAVNLYGSTVATGRWSAGMTGGNSNYRITSGAQGAGTVFMEMNSSTNATNFPNALQQGGNQVVHSGNVASYALPIGGGTVTGQVLIGSYMSLNSSASIMGMVGFNRNAATGAIFNASYGAYQLHNNTGTLELQVYNSAGGFVGAHTFNNSGNVAFLTGTVTAGGNQVVHAGNVSTYALPIGGGTLNGNLTMGSGYQHRASDGSASAPGYSFSAETSTGIYRSGTNTLAFSTGGTQRVTINGVGAMNVTGAITQAGNQVLHAGNYNSYAVDNTKRVKQFFWDSLGASTTQARRFEIARIAIDIVNWNQVGTFEIELHEQYYSKGIKKRYAVRYGYSGTRPGLTLVEMTGAGDNNFQVVLGSEQLVSGNHYYLPIYVDVRYYSFVDVRVTTSRQITTNSTPPVGYTYINSSPTPTNITDFTADSTVDISNAATAWQAGGNVILHAGNYNSYALPLTGGTLTGGLSGTTGSFSGEVTWSGWNSGNARAVRIGYSGGNYGGIGYGINYTSTSGSHTYAFADAVTRIDLADGIQVYSAAAGTAGAAVSWTTLLEATRGNGNLRWKGNTVLDSNNYNSFALPLSGGTMTGNIILPATGYVGLNGGSTYGIGTLATNRNSGVFDTVESTGTDPLELNYYQGGAVKIGSGTYGSKSLYAAGIFDGGNQVVHAGNVSSYALPIGGGTLTGQLTIATGGATGLRVNSPSGTQGFWLRVGYDTDGTATPVASALNTMLQSSGSSAGTFTIVCGNDRVATLSTAAANFAVALQQNGNQVLHAGNYATSYLNGTYLRAAGHPGYADWNTFGNTAQTVHQMYQENFNIPTSTGSSNFPTNASYKYGTLINFGTGADARAQVYISHAGNDLVFRGGWGTAGWNTWNRCVTDVNFPSFGTHQASIGNSLPTTVFMSTDANIRQAPFATAKAHLGITSKWANSRPNNTSDSNYWTGAMGWGTTDWNTVFDWGSGFTDSWSSPANNPGDTSHHVGVQAVHYTNGSGRYGWQMVNGAGTNRWWLRDIWGGGFSSWREVIHSGNYTSYAPNINGGSTIGGITYFSNGESIQAYGIRGRFTNEYLHLYNKVGVGNPSGWGQGEGSTPDRGLSTYGGINVAYGNSAASTFNGAVNVTGTVTGTNFSGPGTGLTGTAASLTAGSANAIADGAVSTTAKLANSVVTYAKIQNVAVSTVLGNSSASVAQAPQALSMATLAGMLSGQTMNINGSSASCTGNAATATNVAASGITGQTGMWTSAARPGPYRLYRRDADDGYSVQTYWTGSRWRLYGYNADTAHADTHVGYADSAGSASSASSATNSTQLNGQAASYYENRDTTAVGISAGTLTLTRAAGNLTTTIGGRVVAWCEFNGNFASTGSPNAAFNVSSITKNATGDYTINFTSALANTNYVVAGYARVDTTNNTTNYNLYIGVARRSTAKTTTSCRIGCEWVNSTLFDAESVGVAFIAA